MVNQNGFTLIEVLIAMAIIGIGLITLLTLFPIGLRSSRLAGDFTTASFIGQQALDNIRASAQVNDPADTFFINTYNERTRAVTDQNSTNRNGLGYYELPISAVKGYLSPLRFPVDPYRSQTWKIDFTGTNAYTVTSSATGAQGTGAVGSLFTANNNEISFIVYENKSGIDLLAPPDGPYLDDYDIRFPSYMEPPYPPDPDYKTYDKFKLGDQLVINIEMRAGVPYYWYAMRAPVTEDVNLNGILEGRLPNGTSRTAPYNQVHEDTGLDLVPDFWDSDMRDIGAGTGGYQPGLDRQGEFSSESGKIDFPGDPHGDNMYRYHSAIGWFGDPAATYVLEVINPSGTEGNGRIDAYPDDYIQKVTVIVGWREGSQDRTATFSASIANQFR